jgi:hypothetical protein
VWKESNVQQCSKVNIKNVFHVKGILLLVIDYGWWGWKLFIETLALQQGLQLAFVTNY